GSLTDLTEIRVDARQPTAGRADFQTCKLHLEGGNAGLHLRRRKRQCNRLHHAARSVSLAGNVASAFLRSVKVPSRAPFGSKAWTSPASLTVMLPRRERPS